MKKRKKRSYLLLELLIAFALLTLCALPLVESPIKMLEEQLFDLEKIELQRYAQNQFAEFKGKLYMNEISWEHLEKPPAEKENFILTIDKTHTREFKKKVSIKTTGKQGREGQEFRMITYTMTFTPKKQKLKKEVIKEGKKKKLKEEYIFDYKVFAQCTNAL